MLLDTNNCASCQACVQVCPHEIWAVTKDEKKITYIEAKNIGKCAMDFACIDACPTGAIEIIPHFS
ncbi:4Fe-4S binding protein [Bacteriovorax sp. PP10]|uniref:4Fe-4S binding protein n=1 Tax=Bacteriovorax antarcticus TaxID=3088717 RepID=A0ABU5W1V9_9BACT|nr:4Fe-4S binding protein [Bacteriovorax sp. PP10]MEA9357810.1 4Fe-4S binding protein [Bacteriovorax sp. PP10]